LTAGTASCLRLRGKIEPSYNVINIRENEIDIYRRFPFDKVEKVIGLKRKTKKKKINDRFTKEKREYR
ncbi:MAG: hypothetical protein R6U35_01285, partial [Candidatus Humimicrobiaceae bacterium]